MGLLNTLKAVKEDGFDPKKDSINGKGGMLDTGVYPVKLADSQFSANKSGYEQIVITLEVVSGEFEGRKEMIFLQFNDELPDFVKERNSKTLLSIASFSNVEFSNNDLEDELKAAEALQRGIGNQFQMNLRVVPNKKNPDYPHRNHEFSELPSDEDLGDLPF